MQNYRHGPPVPQPDYRSPRPIGPQYQQAHQNSPKVSHQEVEINPAINLDGEDSDLFGDCVAGMVYVENSSKDIRPTQLLLPPTLNVAFRSFEP